MSTRIFGRSVLRNSISIPGLLALGVIMVLSWGCASIGNPGGGPRDEDPPRFVGASPAPGSVNISPSRITIEFDELVNVKDAFSKVIISPPGKSIPRVSSAGRRVIVNFTDTLLPETTYTIDFANSIEDNNEGNKLEGFTYSFSTGPELDTLRIAGMVLGARDLEPQQSMLVGVYPAEGADSAFMSLRFSHYAKTDDRGRFIINGLKEGAYRIYALNDRDNDMHYANPEEDLAFYDVEVRPRAERILTTDTIYNLLTGEVDTVIQRMRTLYLPNDILLRSFNSGKKQQYMMKYERMDSTRLSLVFNADTDSLPHLRVLGHNATENDMILERTQGNDTLTYWLPRRLVGVDSLRVAVEYLRTDTVGRLVGVTDTLSFNVARNLLKDRTKAANAKTKSKKDKKDAGEEEEPKTPLTEVKITPTGDINKPVEIEFTVPPAAIDTTAFRLEEMVDTVWVASSRRLRIENADSLSPRRKIIEFERSFGTKYRLTADSLAVRDIYGLHSGPLSSEMTIKEENAYTSLTFVVTGYPDSIPAYIDLLNQSEGVVRSAKVVNGKVVMNYLDPGTYYARIVLDRNGNARFDTGDFETLSQPDETFYFPGKISLKKNFDRQYDWNIFQTAIDLQKPMKLKKNKPERHSGETSDDEDGDEEDEVFDPTRNPFDPNDTGRSGRNNRGDRNNRNNRNKHGASGFTNAM